MASHFSDIGFKFNDDETFYDDFIKVIDDNIHKSAQEVIVGDKGYLVVYVDRDIEFWLPIGENKTLDPSNFEIHYNTHRWESAKNPSWVERVSNDMQGLCNLWQGEEENFVMNINIPNAIMCPEFKEELTYKCQMACFVESIVFYSTSEDFKKVYEQMSEESFIPTGMFSPEEKVDFQESAHAWINGRVESFELKTNTYTNNKFYLIHIACFGEKFDLLVGEEEVKPPIKIGDIVSANVWISGKVRLEYKGKEFGDTKRLVNGSSSIVTLNDLYNVLRESWSKETAYPSCQKDWSKEDPSYGQCAITAMLVNDMFGGSIHRIRVNGGGTHYFNKINGKYVDLTSEQFDLYNIPVDYENNEEMDRQYCGKNADTKKRYDLLVANVKAYLVGK